MTAFLVIITMAWTVLIVEPTVVFSSLFLPGRQDYHGVLMWSVGGGPEMELPPGAVRGVPGPMFSGPKRGPKRGPKQVSEPVVRVEFPETWLWAHTEIGYLLSFDWMLALLITIEASHDCMFRLILASFFRTLSSPNHACYSCVFLSGEIFQCEYLTKGVFL